MKLGLFGANCSYGLIMSHAETTYRATWEHTLQVARTAEEIGLEALVPIARRRGFGGTTNFNGRRFGMGWFSLTTFEEMRAYTDTLRSRAGDEYHRDINTMPYGLVVCRDTEKEAKAAFQNVIDKGDWGAAENVMKIAGTQSQSFNEQIKQFQEYFDAEVMPPLKQAGPRHRAVPAPHADRRARDHTMCDTH
jgi:hypothetical protein